MATVTTSLAETAESIFTDLGYMVEQQAGELRAERKWRVVQITPVHEPDDTPDSGELRCFVTWHENAHDVYDHLAGIEPDYDWAVMGIEETGDYEVYHAPATPITA